jgi:N-acetylmuramoyl-L-alanine amidase
MNRIVATLVLILLPLLPQTSVADQIDVQSARISRAPDHTRLVLDVAGPLHHRIFALADPDRLVIDLTDARLNGKLATPHATDPLVGRIRSGIRDGDDLRIVLDLKRPARAKSFQLSPRDGHGHRLVIDLEPKNRSEGAPREPAPIVAKADPGLSLSVRSKRPPRRNVLIAIDAGHGGKDPGAIGAAGTREKDITLSISRKLAAKVNRRGGMRALLIRDGDYFVHLRRRIEKAREHQADLFVSIHADAFKDRSVRGSSVFTLSHGGATSEAARWLAERENAADLIGGVDLPERNETLRKVLIDMSQSATMEHSGIAAEKVLVQLRTLGKVHQTRIQKAGFAVLKSPDIPSMLVETAFISNPHEEERLRSADYQDRLADKILGGIIDYFSEYPPPGTLFAGDGDSGDGVREPGKYRIVAGDTLSEIAQSHSVSISDLRSANNLRDDQIRVGQVLTIPGS